MADQKFNITIQTAAPTGPVDALERSMNDLSRTTDRLNALGTPEKTRATEFAFYDLDAQLTRTTNTSELMPGAFKKVEKGTRDNASALLMFSQGLEDAQYGMRGVLNNIPGLVMALGGGMGLAGGVSLAAVGLSQLISLFKESSEEAGISAEQIEDAAQKYADAVIGKLDRADAAAARRVQLDNMSDTPDTAGRTAEDNAYQARQDSIAALIAATNTLNELMGRQVVAQEAIAAQEAERDRQRQEAIAKEIEAEERKKQDAKAAYGNEVDQVALKTSSIIETQRQLDLEAQRRDVLLEQKRILEEQVKAPLPALGGGDPTMAAGRQRAFDQALQERQQAQAALDELDKNALANAQAAVARLQERLTGAEKSFEAAADRALGFAEAMERQNAASEQEIRRIMEQGAVKQATDAVTTVAETEKALGGQINEALKIVAASGEQLNGMQQGAVASLQGIMADGKVTSNELAAAITGFQQLNAQLVGDVGRLAAVSQSGILMANDLGRRISALERLVNSTPIPGNTR